MIQKFSRGESIRSTQHLNKMVDEINSVLRRSGMGSGVTMQAGTPVFAINQSAVDLPFGACVPFRENGGSASEPDANPYPIEPQRLVQGTIVLVSDPSMSGVEWGVTAQRIPMGQSGWIYASGVILARVRDADSSDFTVDIDSADDWWHLKRGTSGSGKILWADVVSQNTADDTSSYRWALVRFPFGGSSAFSIVQTTGAGASGAVGAKVIAMKSDPSLSPNFTQTGDGISLKYFKL